MLKGGTEADQIKEGMEKKEKKGREEGQRPGYGYGAADNVRRRTSKGTRKGVG